MDPEVSTPTILVNSNAPVSCCSERVVIQQDKFIYLGYSFNEILEKHETNPTNYNETMSSEDVIVWLEIMEV